MSMLQKILSLTMNVASNSCRRKFEEDTLQAGAVNQAVLKEILNINKDTEYGRKYQFSSIMSAADYKAKVPVTSYEDYRPYIERMADGAVNILTSLPVIYFGLSSGTTGKSKLIPVTAQSRKVVNSNMMLLTQGMLLQAVPEVRKGGRGLFLMNSVKAGMTAGGIPTGAATSGGMNSMRFIVPYLWTSPPEILQLADQRTALYLHLLFALQEKDLAYINAPFPSPILQLFRLLEEEWLSLVNDLAEGSISKQLELEPEVRSKLTKRMRPDTARAEQLAKEARRGMGNITSRLWPKVLYICCVAGGSFSIYMDKLRQYTGDIPYYSAVYGATEAMLGICTRTNDTTYVVSPRTAYHEFIPVEEAEMPNPAVLNLEQLEKGQSYEVVITNQAGFYRYKLGDVVKVVDYYNCSPVIEFLYRKGQLLNVDAEKTQEAAVLAALKKAAKIWGSDLVDYTTAIDLDGPVGRYVFFVEVQEPEKVLDYTTWQGILEKALKEANPRYGAGIEAGRIGSLLLQIVRPGTFQRFQRELILRGASENQVKIPRVLSDEVLKDFLEQCTLSEGIRK
ncbi:GH3 auxin-responsive promoter [Sporotomaculum syntrophicum]|uniref:GH3 auxin-responsive promoter n=1 Tax=Sporotomaculum syntrophicum TaxID=182264 RepID=A0A9D2WMM0_9FIRM|nr:GH3 auxin-responsive promoter family protein [Sporotomaculum syntrophicum]KAF1084195.1 GH3 auxin-responsive promoter [Sporotomaculum syntrophicum]